jgi:hypothetical protein
MVYKDRILLQELTLDKTVIRIGRLADNDIVIDDTSVSRYHAELISRPTGQFLLKDLGSRNGTFVNGKPIAPDTACLLAHDDVINLGAAESKLVFQDEEATRRLGVRARGLVVDEAQHEVYVRGQLLKPPLTGHQYRLLLLLVHKAGQVCSRDEIIEGVWPEAKGGVTDETIDALVKRLRQRLSEHGAEFIVTVPRHGFKLVEP